MATMTSELQDILANDAVRGARFINAFIECSPEVQQIVREMCEILRDTEADAEAKSFASDAMVEALFPMACHEMIRAVSALESLPIDEDDDVSAVEEEESVFADRLRAAMKERGLKQEDLATLSGVSQPAISNMLNRKCRPQRRTIVRFAEALRIDPRELWPGA